MFKTKPMVRFFLPIFLFLIMSCGTEGPFGPRLLTQSTQRTKEKIVLVFVPGYKGSELVRKEDTNSWKKVWLTPLQALGLAGPDLRYGEGDEIREGGVLEAVTLIPGIIDVKVYGPWLNSLRSSQKIRSYVFPYDWRKDNGETSKNLEIFLEKVKKENDGISPIVVGHSNGGTLTLSVLNRRPDLIGKAVFVGAPFRSGIGFMEDLIPGIPTGLNKKITGACVVSTFVSVLTFFPREGSFDTNGVLTDSEGKTIPIRFFKSEDWKNFQLGIFNKESGCETKPSLEAYQISLNKAFSFRNSLEPKKGIKYPQILVIHATNRPTLRTLVGEKRGEEWHWNFEKGKRIPGDGRVTQESSLPPPGIPYDLFVSEAEHSALLNDPKVQNKLFEFAEK